MSTQPWMGNEAERGQVVEATVISRGKGRGWSPLNWGLLTDPVFFGRGVGMKLLKRTGEVAGVSHPLSTNEVCVPQNPPTPELDQGGVSAEGLDDRSLPLHSGPTLLL